MAKMAVMMACVAPAVMVISLVLSYCFAYIASTFAATASRRLGTPAIGGYWFKPPCIAVVTWLTSAGSQLKSGKPWPRLTALCSVANADMTVKIVVPTAGSLV